MDEQRLIDANNFPAKRLDPDECLCGRMYACGWNGVIHLIEDAHTIDPESLPIVQQLRAELERVKAELDAARELLAEYSGVDGCKTIKTCFGYPLDEVQRLVEADKAAKLQRAAKGDDSIESAQETAGKRLP